MPANSPSPLAANLPKLNAIPLWAAIFPVAILIGLLVVNVQIYRDDASYGPNQIALLLAASVAAAVGLWLRVPFGKMMQGIVGSLGSALGAMLILLLIGSLAGTWMISGIVPAMIYYGLEILNPQIFLVATVVVCSIVSIATGSSWSTVATVGIALLGIGKALGVGEAVTAGAIISGAYFGDKMSPLSDTTNLAAAMAGTDLFTHIKYMLWTTVPSILITLAIFAVIGFTGSTSEGGIDTEAMASAIDAKFNLTPLLFLVPAAVLVMVVMKIDAVMALMVGTLLGGLFAVIFQPAVIDELTVLPREQVVAELKAELAPEETTAELAAAEAELASFQASYLKRSYVAVVNAMADETSISSDNERAADLLTGKGMNGMLNTIWLIVTAMCFGGVMEACGLLKRITDPLVAFAQSTGALFATTAGSCIFVNLTASDQYLSIVVPGRMFRETYRERGLAPQNLSRTLEDSGTVTSVLIPWNTCGAAQQSVLGVATLAYAPYCFFNLISPLMTLAYGFAGIAIARLSGDEQDTTEFQAEAKQNRPFELD